MSAPHGDHGDHAPLREGFTTGSAASAAAKAAVHFLLTGQALASADIPLPPGGRLVVPVASVTAEIAAENAAGIAAKEPNSPPTAARARVRKDAGDDPDVTHGASVECLARRLPPSEAQPGTLILTGGRGVGTVTLPGLPVPPGLPAINPEPRRQILAAAHEALADAALPGAAPAFELVVEIPGGEELARRTMNPRLGIVGGLSILGTQGIVRPFSHDAWQASVAQALDVARAAGLTRIAFATGRRSERLWREASPGWPELGVIQAADFFAFANAAAAQRGFTEVTWAVFFGKLVKQAQGLASTHAKDADVDFPALAGLAAELGAPPATAAAITRANTAMEVLTLLNASQDPILNPFLRELVRRATDAARDFAGPTVAIHYAVFDFDGLRLA